MEEIFKINGYENNFRFAKIPALELLSIKTQINFDDLTKITTLYTFALEHTEVEIGGIWDKVKVKNKEQYFPLGIGDDPKAMEEIIFKFLNDVLKPIF